MVVSERFIYPHAQKNPILVIALIAYLLCGLLILGLFSQSTSYTSDRNLVLPGTGK